MEMKHRGKYIARQLSFKNVTFKVEEVVLTPKFINIYDSSIKLWIEMKKAFYEVASLVNADHKTSQWMWSLYWSAHKKFFNYLCISTKVMQAAKIASDAVKCGKCVVIALQSTGEAIEKMSQVSDFVSDAKMVLVSLVDMVERILSAYDDRSILLDKNPLTFHRECNSLGKGTHFYLFVLFTDTNLCLKYEASGISGRKRKAEMEITDEAKKPKRQSRATSLKDRFIAKIEQLGSVLPPNAIDQLIDELGGPINVSEITGRRGRLVRGENGQVKCKSYLY